MKKIVATLSVAVLFSCTLIRAQSPLNVSLEDTLTKVFTQMVEDKGIRGASAAVVFPDESVWRAAAGKYGTADLDPEMLYEIGSNTKTYVAAMMMLLQEEGLLNLDDTLYAYLNPIPKVNYGITLRQLLNHTSGIYNYTNHPDFAVQVNSNMTTFWEVDTLYARFLNAPNFAPGASWSYSNTNYLLLGQVIEEVTGDPFHEAVRDRLLVPLGLEHTFLANYETYNLFKPGSWLDGGGYFDVDFASFMTGAWAAGAIVSTPDDLAMWAYKLYRGDILEPASLDEMRVTEPLAPNLGYGLGVFERQFKGKTYIGHGGTTLQHSEMEYSVESDFSVVAISTDQATPAEINEVHDELICLLEYLLPIYISGTSDQPALTARPLEVFPNPVVETATVNLGNEAGWTLRIYNMQGALVSEERVAGNTATVHQSELGAGLFVLEAIATQSGEMKRGQLMVVGQ